MLYHNHTVKYATHLTVKGWKLTFQPEPSHTRIYKEMPKWHYSDSTCLTSNHHNHAKTHHSTKGLAMESW